jgi:hypothetical protein
MSNQGDGRPERPAPRSRTRCARGQPSPRTAAFRSRSGRIPSHIEGWSGGYSADGPNRQLGLEKLPVSVLLDILDYPYVFSQRELLTPAELVDRAEKRDLKITQPLLVALHRTRRLLPMYWIRDVGKLGAARYSRDVEALREARDAGNLVDPRDSPAALRGHIRDDPKSAFLYSDYQVLALHLLGWELAEMDNVPGGLKPGSILKRMWRGLERVERLKPEELAVLALFETKFFPELVGRILGARMRAAADPDGWFADFESYFTFFDEAEVAARCGLTSDKIQALAEDLIINTYWVDPNRAWLPLIRQMSPDRWRELRGPARLAIDFRLAAEILLRGYESMAQAGTAPALPEIPPLTSHPLAERLKADPGELDSILTEFGISPHPALVLILEGDTEVVLLTRAFRKLGLRNSRNFIEFVKRGGITKPIDALLYLVGPEPEKSGARVISEDVLLLGRPPTRVLVTGDSESDMATEQKREEQRQHWVRQVSEGLLDRHDARIDSADLDRLVETFTWGPLPFEFSCFTDAEIARAVNACRPGATTTQVMRKIRNGRQPGPQYKALLRKNGKVSKRDVAYQLWPMLEAKLDRHLAGGSVGSAKPIVRLFREATRLATEWPRAKLVLRRAPRT